MPGAGARRARNHHPEAPRRAGVGAVAAAFEKTGFDTEFLRSIGLRTVGELMRLPRDGLARRCGPRIVAALDQVLGRTPEAHAFFVPPPRFAAKLELAAETANAEALLFPARR